MFYDLIFLLGLGVVILSALVVLAAAGKIDFDHDFSFLGIDVNIAMSSSAPLTFSITRSDE